MINKYILKGSVVFSALIIGFLIGGSYVTFLNHKKSNFDIYKDVIDDVIEQYKKDGNKDRYEKYKNEITKLGEKYIKNKENGCFSSGIEDIKERHYFEVNMADEIKEKTPVLGLKKNQNKMAILIKSLGNS